MMDCHDMGMCFTATKNVNHLLFKGWHISSIGDMIGTMVAAFLFAVLYEAFKAGVAYHYNKPTHKHQKNNEEQKPLVSSEHTIDHIDKFRLRQHITKTIIYVVNLVYAYILMLVAMSYNVWLFFALVLGLGFGYFLSQPLFQTFLITKKVKRSKSYGSTNERLRTI